MRRYETFYITDAQPEAVEKINSRVREVVEQNQGVFLKTENWGNRPLVFPVRKKKQGSYIRLEYELAPAQVGEIKRALRFHEGVIRFRTFKVEGESQFIPYESAEPEGRGEIAAGAASPAEPPAETPPVNEPGKPA